MSAPRPVSIVLSGIGGMGSVYVQALLDRAGRGDFVLAGAADPFLERCPRLADLKAAGVPVFPSFEELYAGRAADLAIVSSPIEFHASQTILALERDSHVLCEKPLAGSPAEGRAMLEAERKAWRWVAVGYQWSFSEAIQRLKADLMSGLYGRPGRIRLLYHWPRDYAYYGRSDWAGRKRSPRGGLVFDSPANNAMAHDLHNLLYVLGPTTETCDRPVAVRAELYRAYDIENFDTAAARLRTEGGADILFLVSHVSLADRGPVLAAELEKGEIRVSGRGASIEGRLADGSVRDYGNPDREPLAKLEAAIENARTGRRPVCGIEASLGQTLAVEAMQASCPEIAAFPGDIVRETGAAKARRRYVEGLDEVLGACFERNALPSEMGLAWSRRGREIAL